MGILLFITNLLLPQGVYGNEVTFRKHLGIGTRCQGNQPVIRGLALAVPLDTCGEEEGAGIEFSNHCPLT